MTLYDYGEYLKNYQHKWTIQYYDDYLEGLKEVDELLNDEKRAFKTASIINSISTEGNYNV